jgi:hypothetical protein
MLRDRERILSRINSKKLEDYNFTQTRLKTTNVATNLDYQRVYKSFYVMRQRPAAWYRFYFDLLEREKSNRSITFEAVLDVTFETMSGRVEPSFSSKLVATIRPEAPVYHDVVRNNLGIAKPRYDKPAQDRLANARDAYKRIERFYAAALKSDAFVKLKTEFDRRLSDFTHFTNTKKLDVLL